MGSQEAIDVSHTVEINLIADQCIEFDGRTINVHDIKTIHLNEYCDVVEIVEHNESAERSVPVSLNSCPLRSWCNVCFSLDFKDCDKWKVWKLCRDEEE